MTQSKTLEQYRPVLATHSFACSALRYWARGLTGFVQVLRRHARAITALLVMLVIMLPVIWTIHLAFKPALEIFDTTLGFVPTLENFQSLLADGSFLTALGNSVVVSVLSTAFSMLLGVPAAYVLTRWKFKARKQIALWILVTRMAPPIAFTIPFFLAFRWLGLQDTLAGLTLIYMTFNLAIVIWLMQSFFASVPASLEEAAWLDGCGVWSGFWRITLPLAAPGLASTAILCFIFAWSDFFYALVLTRTQAVTATVAIVNFLQYEGWEWGKISAAGTLVMLPVLLFMVIIRRYLVHGLTAGGIKD
jgi:multiple sugar transport system permease protein